VFGSSSYDYAAINLRDRFDAMKFYKLFLIRTLDLPKLLTFLPID
jgi:hypothetical protein